MPSEDPPPFDPLLGNSISGLFDCALAAEDAPTPAAPWQAPTPERAAQLLPQYRIESLIGRGGMGAVYRGTQVALNRPVAIKLLPAELSADSNFTLRFQREAQTLASLSHSGIVSIYDFGTTGEGHLYFVMEFIDGTDLAHALHTQRLEPDQALELTMQICEALHYAHSKGVVHRDIKPANVLLTQDGRAKLADFGLSRPFTPNGTQFTASNLVMGSPNYMAPEQWTGQADHRADIYALGVMLYEMLTGTRPQGAFDLPSVKASVDARLDEVVVKAMRQEPDRRYQQVSELRLDVDRIRTTRVPAQHPKVRPSAPPRKQRSFADVFGWSVFGIVLIGLAWAVVSLLGQRPRVVAEQPAAPQEDVAKPAPKPAPPPPLTITVQPTEPKAPAHSEPAPVAVMPQPAMPATVAAAPVPPDSIDNAPACMEILKSQAINTMKWVLSPLDETVPNDIRQHLTLLREDLVDEGKSHPRAPAAAYSAAWQLCQALLSALDERDKARAGAGYRAAQAAANQSITSQALEARRNYQMSWPQYAREGDQRAELQRQSGNQTALASEAQKVAWANRAASLGRNLDTLYAQFRAAMR